MDQQKRLRRSEHYPEVAPHLRPNETTYDSSFEISLPNTSPAPEYRSHPGSPPLESPTFGSPQFSSASPPLSSSSPPPLDGIARSPSTSDAGWKSSTHNYPVQYSEYFSPHPERVLTPAVPVVNSTALHDREHNDKEYYTKEYYTTQITPINPPPVSVPVEQQVAAVDSAPIAEARRRPIYRRPLCLVFILVVLVAIVVGVACGVVLGGRKTKHSSVNPFSNATTPANATVVHGNPDLAVGGYLSDSYYSTTGAFNGSGIALAAANPGVDQTIYIFYQDYQGNLQWKLMRADGTYSQPLGIINDQSSKPMNGTPLSIVNLQLNATTLTYHLFYIDSNYMVNERVLQTGGAIGGSVFPIWNTGPLTSFNLMTMSADTIGLQACPWLDYYGVYSPANHSAPTLGLHLWFADTETSFQQYDWVNGTASWKEGQRWTGMDGHAGVGCQTWESQTEYVFFVDTNQTIAMFWKDNNQSAKSTSSHPLEKWVKVTNVNIDDVGKSSSLGYTTYVLYQDESAAVRGANITWAAENTTVAMSESSGSPDIFTIEDPNDNDPVEAVRGTHMSITALKTASGGAELQVMFQETGDDVSCYTRDMDKVNGEWQRAASVV